MTTCTSAADTIGTLRASIAELETELKFAEQSLKSDYTEHDTDGVYEGALFRVNISCANRKTTAWKAIATKLHASNQMIAGNSTTSPVTTLRCTAKVKA